MAGSASNSRGTMNLRPSGSNSSHGSAKSNVSWQKGDDAAYIRQQTTPSSSAGAQSQDPHRGPEGGLKRQTAPSGTAAPDSDPELCRLREERREVSVAIARAPSKDTEEVTKLRKRKADIVSKMADRRMVLGLPTLKDQGSPNVSRGNSQAGKDGAPVFKFTIN